MKTISLYALKEIPLIQPKDDVGSIICEVAKKQNFLFQDRDIVVIASKIISKAEGQLIDTDQATPSKEALLLSEKVGIDPKNLEVILRETKRLLIARPNLLLTESLLGFIGTKSGVDSSNTTEGPKGRIVVLLPKDPDLSAAKIRETIKKTTGKEVAVVINDTFGRSDRKGSIGLSIGFSGISAVYSPKNKEDIHGKIRNPEIAQVDEVSASASLLMGQTNERRPVIILRGLEYKTSETDGIKDLLYPATKYIQDALDISSLCPFPQADSSCQKWVRKCPRCGEEMKEVRKDQSENTETGKKYSRTISHCEKDDIWLNFEIPLKMLK